MKPAYIPSYRSNDNMIYVKTDYGIAGYEIVKREDGYIVGVEQAMCHVMTDSEREELQNSYDTIRDKTIKDIIECEKIALNNFKHDFSVALEAEDTENYVKEWMGKIKAMEEVPEKDDYIADISGLAGEFGGQI